MLSTYGLVEMLRAWRKVIDDKGQLLRYVVSRQQLKTWQSEESERSEQPPQRTDQDTKPDAPTTDKPRLPFAERAVSFCSEAVMIVGAIIAIVCGVCAFLMTAVALVSAPGILIAWLIGRPWLEGACAALVAAFAVQFAYANLSKSAMIARAAQLLVLRRCGACGYPLRTESLSPTPGDGATVAPLIQCPECGARWKTKRLQLKGLCPCGRPLQGESVGPDCKVCCSNCGRNHTVFVDWSTAPDPDAES